jgi:hypothetical protein
MCKYLKKKSLGTAWTHQWNVSVMEKLIIIIIIITITVIFNAIQIKKLTVGIWTFSMANTELLFYVLEVAQIYADINTYLLGAHGLYLSMFLPGSYSRLKIIGD